MKNAIRNLMKPWKKFVASAVALSILYLAVAVPVLEANLWSERREAQKKEYPQYAQLPASFMGLGQSQAQASESIPPVGSIGSFQQAAPVTSKAANIAGFKEAAAALPPSVLALPYSYGEITRIRISGDKNAPFIFLIQDAHEIESAQRNIAGALAHLQEKFSRSAGQGRSGALLVGIEGAEGAFATSAYRNLGRAEIRRDLHNSLLQKSMITGAEYFALSAPREPLLWGVEQKPLYLDNVSAYRDGLESWNNLSGALDRLDAELAALKDKIFSAEMKAFDAKLAAFDRRELSLTDLARYFAESGAVSSARQPEISKYLDAARIEKSLDFKKVEKEREGLVRRLSQKLNRAELGGLLQMSVAYRLGHVGYGDYYSYLKEALAKSGVKTGDYPQFNEYVRYVLMTERVKPAALLGEIEALRREQSGRLAATPEQKQALRRSALLRMARKMARQELSPEEWAAYQKSRGEIAGLPDLSRYEAFYEASEKRNIALTQNLLTKLASLNEASSALAASASTSTSTSTSTSASASARSPFAVLIAGGFHTPGVEKELEVRGCSFAVFRPRMGKVESSGTDYLHAFNTQRTPLEQVLLGEKLFVNPPAALALANMSGLNSAGARTDVLDTGEMTRVAATAIAAVDGVRNGTLDAQLPALEALPGPDPKIAVLRDDALATEVSVSWPGRASVSAQMGSADAASVSGPAFEGTVAGEPVRVTRTSRDQKLRSVVNSAANLWNKVRNLDFSTAKNWNIAEEQVKTFNFVLLASFVGMAASLVFLSARTDDAFLLAAMLFAVSLLSGIFALPVQKNHFVYNLHKDLLDDPVFLNNEFGMTPAQYANYLTKRYYQFGGVTAAAFSLTASGLFLVFSASFGPALGIVFAGAIAYGAAQISGALSHERSNRGSEASASMDARAMERAKVLQNVDERFADFILRRAKDSREQFRDDVIHVSLELLERGESSVDVARRLISASPDPADGMFTHRISEIFYTRAERLVMYRSPESRQRLMEWLDEVIAELDIVSEARLRAALPRADANQAGPIVGSLVNLLIGQERYKDAMELALARTREAPGDIYALAQLSQVQLAMEANSDALVSAQQAFSIDPSENKNVRVRIALAEALRANNAIAEAHSLMVETVQLYPRMGRAKTVLQEIQDQMSGRGTPRSEPDPFAGRRRWAYVLWSPTLYLPGFLRDFADSPNDFENENVTNVILRLLDKGMSASELADLVLGSDAGIDLGVLLGIAVRQKRSRILSLSSFEDPSEIVRKSEEMISLLLPEIESRLRSEIANQDSSSEGRKEAVRLEGRLVNNLLVQGKNEEALDRARTIIAQDPESSKSWVLLARVQLARDDVQAALAASQTAFVIGPNYIRARNIFAEANLRAGDTQTALAILRETLQIPAFSKNDRARQLLRNAEKSARRGGHLSWINIVIAAIATPFLARVLLPLILGALGLEADLSVVDSYLLGFGAFNLVLIAGSGFMHEAGHYVEGQSKGQVRVQTAPAPGILKYINWRVQGSSAWSGPAVSLTLAVISIVLIPVTAMLFFGMGKPVGVVSAWVFLVTMAALNDLNFSLSIDDLKGMLRREDSRPRVAVAQRTTEDYARAAVRELTAKKGADAILENFTLSQALAFLEAYQRSSFGTGRKMEVPAESLKALAQKTIQALSEQPGMEAVNDLYYVVYGIGKDLDGTASTDEMVQAYLQLMHQVRRQMGARIYIERVHELNILRLNILQQRIEGSRDYREVGQIVEMLQGLEAGSPMEARGIRPMKENLISIGLSRIAALRETRRVEAEARRQIALHTDGMAQVQMLNLLNERGILVMMADASAEGRALTMADIIGRMPVNEAYLHHAFYKLAMYGWITREGLPGTREMRFELTERGIRAARLIADTNRRLGWDSPFLAAARFIATARRMDAFLFGNAKDGSGPDSFAQLVRLSGQNWNLESRSSDDEITREVKEVLAYHVNGIIAGPAMIALKDEHYFGLRRVLANVTSLWKFAWFQRWMAKARYGAVFDQFDPHTHALDLSTVRAAHPERILTIFRFLERRGLVTLQNNIATLTPLGLAAVEDSRAWGYGVPSSYYPTYNELENLYFGDATILWRTTTEGKIVRFLLGIPGINWILKHSYLYVRDPLAERHVNRPMNVKGSGASHKGYFAQLDPVIKEIFDNPDIDAQPRGFADMGAGDGTMLQHMYEFVMNNTLRGQIIRQIKKDPELTTAERNYLLEQYDLVMVGGDYNNDARIEIKKRLNRAGIPSKVVFGNIIDPLQFKADIETQTFADRAANFFRRVLRRPAVPAVRSEDLLHIRSMLDHNLPWTPPADMAAAEARLARWQADPASEPLSNGSFSWRGEVIQPHVLKQRFVEHFAGWRAIIGRHGLITIDLHYPEQVTVGETLANYIDSHSHSDQFTQEAAVASDAAEQAGLHSLWRRRIPSRNATISIDRWVAAEIQAPSASVSQLAPTMMKTSTKNILSWLPSWLLPDWFRSNFIAPFSELPDFVRMTFGLKKYTEFAREHPYHPESYQFNGVIENSRRVVSLGFLSGVIGMAIGGVAGFAAPYLLFEHVAHYVVPQAWNDPVILVAVGILMASGFVMGAAGFGILLAVSGLVFFHMARNMFANTQNLLIRIFVKNPEWVEAHAASVLTKRPGSDSGNPFTRSPRPDGHWMALFIVAASALALGAGVTLAGSADWLQDLNPGQVVGGAVIAFAGVSAVLIAIPQVRDFLRGATMRFRGTEQILSMGLPRWEARSPRNIRQNQQVVGELVRRAEKNPGEYIPRLRRALFNPASGPADVAKEVLIRVGRDKLESYSSDFASQLQDNRQLGSAFFEILEKQGFWTDHPEIVSAYVLSMQRDVFGNLLRFAKALHEAGRPLPQDAQDYFLSQFRENFHNFGLREQAYDLLTLFGIPIPRADEFIAARRERAHQQRAREIQNILEHVNLTEVEEWREPPRWKTVPAVEGGIDPLIAAIRELGELFDPGEKLRLIEDILLQQLEVQMWGDIKIWNRGTRTQWRSIEGQLDVYAPVRAAAAQVLGKIGKSLPLIGQIRLRAAMLDSLKYETDDTVSAAIKSAIGEFIVTSNTGSEVRPDSGSAPQLSDGGSWIAPSWEIRGFPIGQIYLKGIAWLETPAVALVIGNWLAFAFPDAMAALHPALVIFFSYSSAFLLPHLVRALQETYFASLENRRFTLRLGVFASADVVLLTVLHGFLGISTLYLEPELQSLLFSALTVAHFYINYKREQILGFFSARIGHPGIEELDRWYQAEQEAPEALKVMLKYARQAGYSFEQIQFLLEWVRMEEFVLTITMDNGSRRSFNAWRLHHSDKLGTPGGGIRMAPDVVKEMIENLSAEMSLKTAVLEVGLGGSKGGIAADPRELSKREQARIMRAYADALYDRGAIGFKQDGSSIDKPAPDVNTTSAHMAQFLDQYLYRWLNDESDLSEHVRRLREYSAYYDMQVNIDDSEATPYLNRFTADIRRRIADDNDEDSNDRKILGIITGKPEDLGGIPGRTEATGRGVIHALNTYYEFSLRGRIRRFLERRGWIRALAMAVQGFGNVGSFTAEVAIEEGYRVTAIGEFINGRQVIFKKDAGFTKGDLERLKAYISDVRQGLTPPVPANVQRIAEGEQGYIPILEQNVDIVVPAARENQITEENAVRIKARVILEAANGPTAKEADPILEARKIVVIPDILVNAGGVLVSSFEMRQAFRGRFWTHKQTLSGLEKKMKRAANTVLQTAARERVTLREAAYRVALKNLVGEPPAHKSISEFFRSIRWVPVLGEMVAMALLVLAVIQRAMGVESHGTDTIVHAVGIVAAAASAEGMKLRDAVTDFVTAVTPEPETSETAPAAPSDSYSYDRAIPEVQASLLNVAASAEDLAPAARALAFESLMPLVDDVPSEGLAVSPAEIVLTASLIQRASARLLSPAQLQVRAPSFDALKSVLREFAQAAEDSNPEELRQGKYPLRFAGLLHIYEEASPGATEILLPLILREMDRVETARAAQPLTPAWQRSFIRLVGWFGTLRPAPRILDGDFYFGDLRANPSNGRIREVGSYIHPEENSGPRNVLVIDRDPAEFTARVQTLYRETGHESYENILAGLAAGRVELRSVRELQGLRADILNEAGVIHVGNLLIALGVDPARVPYLKVYISAFDRFLWNVRSLGAKLAYFLLYISRDKAFIAQPKDWDGIDDAIQAVNLSA